MKYLLRTMSNYCWIITEEIKNEVIKAGNGGKRVYIMPSGEVVPLNPFPTIITMERARTNDSDYLAVRGKHRCKYGNVHQYDGFGCKCHESLERGDNVVDVFSHWIDEDRLNEGAIKRINDLRTLRLNPPARLPSGEPSI